MKGKITYLVTYDIVENAARTRAADTLKDYGVRIQKSVFECALTSAELRQLKSKLIALIDNSTDSIAFYPICAACAEKKDSVGITIFFPNKEFLVL